MVQIQKTKPPLTEFLTLDFWVWKICLITSWSWRKVLEVTIELAEEGFEEKESEETK